MSSLEHLSASIDSDSDLESCCSTTAFSEYFRDIDSSSDIVTSANDVENNAKVEDNWGCNWGVQEQIWQNTTSENCDWCPDPEAEMLRWQELTSVSQIARRVAKVGVLVPDDVAEFFARLEMEAVAKRGIRLRKKRHQRTILIDTTSKLRDVLDRLVNLDHSKPQVVVDCEGLNFKQTGTIDIMELFVRPEDILYLIDVVALKDAAWSTSARRLEFSLHTFLSSKHHMKIMWDLRADAHILNSLYGIRLDGIIDSSLWAVAYRGTQRTEDYRYRVGILTACKQILRRQLYQEEINSLEEAKDRRSTLPPRPWAIRPLPELLIDYAADVKYMGMVYDCVKEELGQNERLVQQIVYYTEQELEMSCDPFYDALCEREPVSPWSGYLAGAKEALRLDREDAEIQARLEAAKVQSSPTLVTRALGMVEWLFVRLKARFS